MRQRFLGLAIVAATVSACFIDIAPLQQGGAPATGGGPTTGGAADGGAADGGGGSDAGGTGGGFPACEQGFVCADVPVPLAVLTPAAGGTCPTGSTPQDVLSCTDGCVCTFESGGCGMHLLLYTTQACDDGTYIDEANVPSSACLDLPIAATAVEGETVGIAAQASESVTCVPAPSQVPSEISAFCAWPASACGAASRCLPDLAGVCILVPGNDACPNGFGLGQLVAGTEESLPCDCECLACVEAEYLVFEEPACAGPASAELPGLGECVAQSFSTIRSVRDGNDDGQCTPLARPQAPEISRLCCAE